jgi:hypothetical protein
MISRILSSTSLNSLKLNTTCKSATFSVVLFRSYISLTPDDEHEHLSHSANLKLNAAILPKAIYVNGTFASKWTKDTKKGLSSVIQMLKDRMLRSKSTLDEINAVSYLENVSVDLDKMNFGPSFTWVSVLIIYKCFHILIIMASNRFSSLL